MLNHLKTHLGYLKISIKSALEYRTNFIVQTLSMVFNDIVWIVFWLIIFSRFSQINGWDIKDMLLLYTVVLTSYGLTGVFFGNTGKMSSVIVEGRLDYYMVLPKNILYHLISSRSSWFSLGDLLLGLGLAIAFIPIDKAPLYIIFVIMSTMIIIAYEIIIGSLSFLMQNSEETSRTLRMALVSFSSYPLSIYSGFTRMLILFVIPAGFVAGVPVQLLNQFDMTWLLYTAAFAFTILIVSISFFYWGLRRYESGNLLYVRT